MSNCSTRVEEAKNNFPKPHRKRNYREVLFWLKKVKNKEKYYSHSKLQKNIIHVQNRRYIISKTQKNKIN
jgi:hypothetical protein